MAGCSAPVCAGGPVPAWAARLAAAGQMLHVTRPNPPFPAGGRPGRVTRRFGPGGRATGGCSGTGYSPRQVLPRGENPGTLALPTRPGCAAGPGHRSPYTGAGKTPPYRERGITYGVTVPARAGPGTGTGRDGDAPGANAADMGQDTGTTHFFPNPVLTKLTYKKKNTKSIAIKLLFSCLARAVLVRPYWHCSPAPHPTTAPLPHVGHQPGPLAWEARGWHNVYGTWGWGFFLGLPWPPFNPFPPIYS